MKSRWVGSTPIPLHSPWSTREVGSAKRSVSAVPPKKLRWKMQRVKWRFFGGELVTSSNPHTFDKSYLNSHFYSFLLIQMLLNHICFLASIIISYNFCCWNSVKRPVLGASFNSSHPRFPQDIDISSELGRCPRASWSAWGRDQGMWTQFPFTDFHCVSYMFQICFVYLQYL